MQKNHTRDGLFVIMETRARFVTIKTAGLITFMCGNLVVYSGCAYTNERLDVSYQPIAEKKSPLSGIPGRKLALHVEDERPEDSRDRVGVKKNGLGMVSAKILSNEPVTHVLYYALEREFNNNGHQIIDAEIGACDAVVKIQIRKFWSEVRVHVLVSDLQMIGTISAGVVVLHAPTGSELLSTQINATVQHQMGLAPAYESILNEALKEFVHNFAFDSHILTALQHAGKDDPDHP